jgi:hypothetical protein
MLGLVFVLFVYYRSSVVWQTWRWLRIRKKYLSRRDLQQTGCTSWWECVYLNTRNGYKDAKLRVKYEEVPFKAGYFFFNRRRRREEMKTHSVCLYWPHDKVQQHIRLKPSSPELWTFQIFHTEKLVMEYDRRTPVTGRLPSWMRLEDSLPCSQKPKTKPQPWN